MILFEQEKDRLRITRIDDEDPIRISNHLEKNQIGKGFSEDKTLRKIGEIPVFFLLQLPPEEQEAFQKDPSYIRVLLKKYPQWRCSEGEI